MFLYFVSDGSAEPPTELEYSLQRGRVTARQVSQGPSGQAGKILCDVSMARCGYWPNEQAWRKLPGTSHWVGMFEGSPPGPEKLRRDRMLAGHLVQLGDGQQWTVPVARALTGADGDARYTVALPRLVEIDDAGQWVYGDVLPRYRRLWDIAATWYDHIVAGVQDESGHVIAAKDPQWCYSAAVEVLRINYRVGAVELSMLRAFETEAYVDILNATIDYPTLMARINSAKKKQQGTENCSSSVGDAA